MQLCTNSLHSELWTSTTETDTSSAASLSPRTPTKETITTRKRIRLEISDTLMAKEARRRLMYRQRAKNDRESLRKEVIQLTDHLEKLTQAKNNKKEASAIATAPHGKRWLCAIDKIK